MDISVFIPVYKESDQIEGVIGKLASQNVTKEIFVTVDDPTEAFQQQIEHINIPNVQFIVNKERMGKSNALNATYPTFHGKALLFLDSDVGIPDDPDYLRKSSWT